MASRASCALVAFALLWQCIPTTAQAVHSRTNVTLRLFQESQEGSCGYSNTTNALTFTTESIPIQPHCFNVADLFGGNATQGFVNQTRFLTGITGGEAGIYWQLSNLDTYDPSSNYSSVLFQQYLASPQTKSTLPGMYGDRVLNLYGGPDCSELDPEEDVFRDWYGFSCWSEPEGTCGTLPHKLVSFSVQPGIAESQQDSTCWAFAHMGTAAEGPGRSQMVVRVLVGAAIAVWLA